jgi:hypothetical protein
VNAWKPLLLVTMTLGLLGALPLTGEGAVKAKPAAKAKVVKAAKAPKAAKPAAAASPCLKASGGTWSFGQAPTGCQPLTNPATLEERYPDLVFNERAGNEKRRYTAALHAYLREAADYYLDQRRRNADPAERSAWRKAVMALAHQESFWSHYRESRKDGELKIMRGDANFAHGLLQIDERWHPKMTMNARGEDLTAHLMYGLDMYFQGWEKAAKASCVRKGNTEDRARAAYAAYNGGSSKLCRWKDPKDRWARNDEGFLAKWKGQGWQYAGAAESGRSPVDVACLAEGRAGCANVIELKVQKLVHYYQANAPRAAFRGEERVACLSRAQRKQRLLNS